MIVIALAAMAVAAIQATTECIGCHTESRTVPPSRFEVGLGHWAESNCVGCHHEMNEVAREGIVLGRKGASYRALPLSEEQRAAIVVKPLSFTSAPEDVGLKVGPFVRVDSQRLLDFLRRPVDARRAPGETDRMMAFPDLSWDDMPDVVSVLSAQSPLAATGVCETPPQSSAAPATAVAAVPGPASPRAGSDGAGGEIWETRCKRCHESTSSLAGRPAPYLALFTPGWVYAYANGLSGRPDGGERAMPVVPLSREASEALFTYFGARKADEERKLDERVRSLGTADVEKRTAGRTLMDDERAFVWTKFLREGKCVHCHGAEGHRAFQRLPGTAWALARYVREHGGMAIWRRLETRALEAEVGMTASAPGMPMASDPLSRDVRDLIYLWAREGCPAPSGFRECGAAQTPSKRH